MVCKEEIIDVFKITQDFPSSGSGGRVNLSQSQQGQPVQIDM